MGDSTKAIVMVIIIGLIAIVATLPDENPVKIKLNGMVAAVAGDNAATDKQPQSQKAQPAAQAATAQNAVQAAPFDESVTTGSREADAIRKKANAGDVKSQLRLGNIYLNGSGVPRDYIIAYMWFNIARANGSKEAKEALAKLAPKMDNRQIGEAQKLASLWWDTYRR